MDQIALMLAFDAEDREAVYRAIAGEHIPNSSKEIAR